MRRPPYTSACALRAASDSSQAHFRAFNSSCIASIWDFFRLLAPPIWHYPQNPFFSILYFLHHHWGRCTRLEVNNWHSTLIQKTTKNSYWLTLPLVRQGCHEDIFGRTIGRWPRGRPWLGRTIVSFLKLPGIKQGAYVRTRPCVRADAGVASAQTPMSERTQPSVRAGANILDVIL
jgi:hypothetical protein